MTKLMILLRISNQNPTFYYKMKLFKNLENSFKAFFQGLLLFLFALKEM